MISTMSACSAAARSLVGKGHRAVPLEHAHVRACQLAPQLDRGRVGDTGLAQCGRLGLQELGGARSLLIVVQSPAKAGDGSGDRGTIGPLASDLEGSLEELLGQVLASGTGGRLACATREIGDVALHRGDRDRLLQERDRLVGRAQRHRPVRRGTQRQACLRGQRVCLGALGRVLECGEVVAGERAGQLVAADALEVARRGQVALAAIRACQRVVGDLTDEALNERVLTALRRPRWASKTSSSRRTRRPEPRLERGVVDAGEMARGRRA